MFDLIDDLLAENEFNSKWFTYRVSGGYEWVASCLFIAILIDSGRRFVPK